MVIFIVRCLQGIALQRENGIFSHDIASIGAWLVWRNQTLVFHRHPVNSVEPRMFHNLRCGQA